MHEQIESRMTAGVATRTTSWSLQERATVPERFVDSIAAAEFLSVKPRQVLDMARAGAIPGHPFGIGKRKTWRFRLSELEASLSQREANLTAPIVRRTNRSRRSSDVETGR